MCRSHMNREIMRRSRMPRIADLCKPALLQLLRKSHLIYCRMFAIQVLMNFWYNYKHNISNQCCVVSISHKLDLSTRRVVVSDNR